MVQDMVETSNIVKKVNANGNICAEADGVYSEELYRDLITGK